jgi:hypothetical protein
VYARAELRVVAQERIELAAAAADVVEPELEVAARADLERRCAVRPRRCVERVPAHGASSRVALAHVLRVPEVVHGLEVRAQQGAAQPPS